MTQCHLALAGLTVLVVTACGDGDRGDVGPPITPWTVAPAPRTVIGGVDDRGGLPLHQVLSATRMEDGRVVILNGGTSELLFYDSLGTHLFSAGGLGNGPGEFINAFEAIRLPGDTLLVLSFRPGLTWFGPDGEFVRSRRVDLWGVGSAPCRIGEGNWHPLPDGSLLTVLEDNFEPAGCPARPPSPWRMSGLIGRSRLEQGLFDTIAIMPATERNSPNFRVFGRSLVIAHADDRVYAADTGADEILVFGLAGDTAQVLPSPFDAVPVPGDARRQRNRTDQVRGGPVEVGTGYLYPDAYPRVGRIIVDEVGNLWVMAYPEFREPMHSWRLTRSFAFVVEDGGARWRVIGTDGTVSAELRTPAGLFPLEIGADYVLGLSRDDLDVQSVELYALTR